MSSQYQILEPAPLEPVFPFDLDEYTSDFWEGAFDDGLNFDGMEWLQGHAFESFSPFQDGSAH